MKALLLHLSDIHISSESDPILTRTRLMAAAAQSVGSEAASCIVLITGDIASKGSAEEYGLATELLSHLHSDLAAALRLDHTAVVVLPLAGNHDCDFSRSQIVRDRLAASLVSDSSGLDSPEVGDVLAAPQANYRAFVQELRTKGICPAPRSEDVFLTQYSCAIGDKVVDFCLLNSALLSRIREAPGQLRFPPGRIPKANTSPLALAITAFHHPYQWFHPDNARELRAAIEQSSDLVFTGHEHVASHRRTSLATGENFTQIEAPVLQDRSQPQNSGFNLFVLDLSTKRQMSFEFFYNGSHYGTQAGDSPPEWTELALNRIRTRGTFPFSEKHEQRIDDPGVSLRSGDLVVARLSDFFVFPDLLEVSLENPTPRLVKGERIPSVLAEHRLALVTGDGCSGKSSLAKALCRAFHNRGDVPLLINADKTLLGTQTRQKHLDRSIAEQYNPALVDRYWQLDFDRRILIIDDFDRIQTTASLKSQLLNALHARFARILLLADDFAAELFELTDVLPTELVHFRIQPFGHLHRDELVEKWLCINSDTDGATLARKVAETTRTLDQVVGSGFVPAYPVYVLAVLQACDAAMPVDTSISTHGYYFELLIRSELLAGATSKDYDVLTGYLSYVAFRMFGTQKRDLTTLEFSALHSEYVQKYDVSLSMDKILERLCSRRMLVRANDLVEFKYHYIYHYFVASYLRDHLDDLEIRGVVANLAENTHRRLCADVLLFLAHLSKDKFIINTLLSRADKHYAGRIPVKELEDVSVPGDLRETLKGVRYEEVDVRESRRQIAATRDQFSGGGADLDASDIGDEFDEALAPIRDLLAALRTMQVLGQVLKNYPGHLEAETKFALAKSGYGIGVRAWRGIYALMLDNKGELARELVQAFHVQDPDASADALNERAEHAIRGLICLSALGFIQRMADALGAPELGATYDKLIGSENSEIVRIVHLAIQLEHSPVVPEGELIRTFDRVKGIPLAEWIVQQLAVRHFHFFPVRPAIKQKICSKIGIDYKSGLKSDRRTKLLKG